MLETRPLLAHCITVDDADIEMIREPRARASRIVPSQMPSCGHGRAPFARFLAANLKVGLGSDSVASNNNCDILEEARFATLLARGRGTDFSLRPTSAPRLQSVPLEALFAATLGGARALGLDGQIGALPKECRLT